MVLRCGFLKPLHQSHVRVVFFFLSKFLSHVLHGGISPKPQESNRLMWPLAPIMVGVDVRTTDLSPLHEGAVFVFLQKRSSRLHHLHMLTLKSDGITDRIIPVKENKNFLFFCKIYENCYRFKPLCKQS